MSMPSAQEQEKYIYQAQVPIISEHDEKIIRALPYPAREEVRDNIHRYIEQMGRDYLPKETPTVG